MTGATWMVTGGTGSLGRKLVPHILDKYDPRKVIVYARTPDKHERMERECPDPRLRHILGDVRDRDLVLSAMRGVDYVVHAAAQKYVTYAEYCPSYTRMINVDGTEIVADSCVTHKVKRAVFISTDKAVSPLNTYGVTKAAAERLWLARCAQGLPVFSAVRYGNVLYSEGSVLNLFKRLEADGAVVLPVTDEHMTRFAMDWSMALAVIDEAIVGPPQVIYVGKAPSFKVLDLCAAMEKLISRSGMRAGEKPHEVLVSEYESSRTTDWGTHYRIAPDTPADTNVDYGGGFPMPVGWRYASNTNWDRLTVDDLKLWIGRE